MKTYIAKQHGAWLIIARASLVTVLLTISGLADAGGRCCSDEGFDCNVRNYSDGCEWDNEKCVYFGLPVRSAFK